MTQYAIQLRSYSPDLLVEFELPPGTHARLGNSSEAEVSIPCEGLPPIFCTIGRFGNGRLFLAEIDGSISQRLDLPATLALPPFRFEITNPALNP